MGADRQRRVVAPMFPAVDDFAELRPPVADVIVRDDPMPEEPRDPGQRIAQDRAADVPHVHRLRDVGAGEIDHDRLRLRGGRHAQHGVGGHACQALLQIRPA